VLFWANPVDLGRPFGDFDVVGAVVAVALWLYLLHTLALMGYIAAMELDRLTRGCRYIDRWRSVVWDIHGSRFTSTPDG
jgi:membrane protein